MELKLIQVLNMKMHEIQFVSMMMVIQMKLTKVICKMKNTMIQEFQLDMESQLIQVTKMKIATIQFVQDPENRELICESFRN
jgi:hypothetical protein